MVCAKIISAWLPQVQRKHVSRQLHSKLKGILPLKLRQRVNKQRHRTVMLSQWLADIVMKRYVRYWAYCFHWKTLKAKYPRDILLTAVVTYHYSRTVFLPNRRRRVDAILQLNFHCHSRWHGILCLTRYFAQISSHRSRSRMFTQSNYLVWSKHVCISGQIPQLCSHFSRLHTTCPWVTVLDIIY